MDDILYNELPCVAYLEKYILFSPYNQKLVSLSKQQLKDNSVRKNLEALGFFGKPELLYKKSKTSKIILSTTYDCNLFCKYCFVKGGERKIYMSKNLALAALNTTLKNDIDRIIVHFFGGEPTLNFNVLETCVNFLKDKGVQTEFEITTNGIVNDKKIDYLLNKNFLFSVSLDGPPDIQNYHRPTAHNSESYSKVVSTIKRVLSNTDELRIRTTITSKSVERMDEIVEHFHGLGISFIHFEPFIPFGRGDLFSNLKPDVDKYCENFIKSMDKAKELGMKITDFSIFSLLNPTRQRCFTLYKNRFVVTPDNKITFCLGVQEGCGKISEIFSIGEYKEGDDILKCDFGKINRLMKYFSVDKIRKCKDCFAKYLCCGVCPAHNALKTGNPHIVDDFSCKIRKVLIKEAIIRMWKQSSKMER